MDQTDAYYFQDVRRDSCKVSLQNKDLWKQFHERGTEMVITKSGRRMFPGIRIQIKDLDPEAHYCILMEMNPASNCRYKYSSSTGWSPAGSEEAHSPHRMYLHPESPATGQHWMSQPVSFGRMKLTNTPTPPLGHVVLSSMHKYQPRVIIVRARDPRAIGWAPSTAVTFPETQFIAVTAYQNEKITKLKIDNNPFAKGFREKGKSTCKRKRLQVQQRITEEDVEQRSKKVCIDETSSQTESLEDRVSTGSSSPEVIVSAVHYPGSSGACCSPISRHPYAESQYPPSIVPRHNIDMYPYYYASYPVFTPMSWPPMSYPYYHRSHASPQDLSTYNKRKPKILTDFSIRAITGSP